MSSDFGETFGADLGKAGDKELQEFLMVEKQKAQFNAQIHEFNDFCWEKCVDKPSNKLDSRTETCLTNCVDRFIDILPKNSGQIRGMASEQISWPPPKMKERMLQMQRDDGVPVYLKGGMSDKLLYQFTVALALFGTAWGYSTILGMAFKKK